MEDNKEPKSTEEKIEDLSLIRSDALREYATHVGSALIKPEEKGKIKGIALSAMYEQTDNQFQQIKEQIDLLALQAKQLQKRIQVSEEIYKADYSFEPVIMKTYYLYRRADQTHILSMIAPHEWGRSFKHEFVAEAKLLSDHTWEVME